MKITKLFFLVVFVLLLNGCCKNCDDDINKLKEANKELVNLVMDNLLAKKAMKEIGNSLEAKGNISFDFVLDRDFGLFDEGFDFEINSQNEIAGLYIRIKRDDAISDDYLNIELSEQSFEIKIDTDFSEGIGDGFNVGVAIGNICYEVRVYDSTGNVSKPKDVCFDLIGWGNDGAIARAWELQYYKDTLTGNIIKRNLEEVYCDNGQDKPCFSQNHKFFSITDDGTFDLQTLRYEYENGDSDSDYDRYEEGFEGKWVYIENHLYLIVYSNSLLKNETVVHNSKMKLGEGSILVFSEVTLDDDFQPLNMNMIVNQPDKNGKQKKITEYYSRPRDL